MELRTQMSYLYPVINVKKCLLNELIFAPDRNPGNLRYSHTDVVHKTSQHQVAFLEEIAFGSCVHLKNVQNH